MQDKLHAPFNKISKEEFMKEYSFPLNGIYKNLSIEEYHNDRSAVSRSGLWEFKKAPLKYWNAYLNPEREPKKNTPDMIFGSAFHTLVLEPDKFNKEYAIEPVKVLLKDVGRELYDAYKQQVERLEGSGKIVLTHDEMVRLKRMRDSVLSHPQASQLITGGAIEHSLFWEDPHTGVRCKTRPDIWLDNMTVDLKTTADASERAFINSVASFGYHLQSVFNREGIYHTGGNDIKNHTFICVEKEWPHLVAVYILDKNALDSAHRMFKNTLTDFQKCLDSNEWPGYEVKEISLPNWAE